MERNKTLVSVEFQNDRSGERAVFADGLRTIVYKKRESDSSKKGFQMKESVIMKKIQILLATWGFRMFRNNTGVLQDRNGTYVRYGLCNGSSDLIGWKQVRIEPWHIGMNMAQFVACEVKQPGKKATEEQKNFISAVIAAGGIGFVASSEEEALRAIQR